MKIVHYLRRINFADGGVVRAVLDMTKVTAKRQDVHIITCDAADADEAWKQGQPGCPVLDLIALPTKGGGRFDAAALAEIQTMLQSADVLHLHGPWELENLQLAAIARRIGLPYLITAHGMLDDWSMAQRGLKKKLFLLLAGNRMLRGAARYHLTADAEWQQVRKYIPPGTPEIIPYVFDTEPFIDLPDAGRARRLFGGDDATPTVLFLSRLHYKKGPEVLIEAAARLRDRGVNCTVLLAGSGEDNYIQSLEALIGEHDLADRVRLIGLVTGDDKLALYRMADILAVPTSQENFGLVFPEALCCGTPIITTRGVDIWNELLEGGAADIVEPTPNAFADTIEAMLNDRDALRQRGERGREWAMQYFDPGQTSERFVDMYRRIIAEHSAPA